PCGPPLLDRVGRLRRVLLHRRRRRGLRGLRITRASTWFPRKLARRGRLGGRFLKRCSSRWLLFRFRWLRAQPGKLRIQLLPLHVQRHSDGEGDDGSRGNREIPATPAGGRHERRQARFGGATRGRENSRVELARRLFAPELSVALRN